MRLIYTRFYILIHTHIPHDHDRKEQKQKEGAKAKAGREAGTVGGGNIIDHWGHRVSTGKGKKEEAYSEGESAEWGMGNGNRATSNSSRDSDSTEHRDAD
jgi:hypothetical protein